MNKLLKELHKEHWLVKAAYKMIEAHASHETMVPAIEQVQSMFTKLDADTAIATWVQANASAKVGDEFAARDAEVAKVAVISALRLYGEPSMSVGEIDRLADRYADQLRQKANPFEKINKARDDAKAALDNWINEDVK